MPEATNAHIRRLIELGLSDDEIDAQMADDAAAQSDELAAHGDDHAVYALSAYGPVNDAGERGM